MMLMTKSHSAIYMVWLGFAKNTWPCATEGLREGAGEAALGREDRDEMVGGLSGY